MFDKKDVPRWWCSKPALSLPLASRHRLHQHHHLQRQRHQRHQRHQHLHRQQPRAVGIEDWGGVKLGLLMLLTDVWVLVLDVLN